MGKTQVLVVEDEQIIALEIQSTLRELGYAVSSTASSGEEAIAKTAETLPDLVLMDIRLSGDMDGIEAAEQIRSRFDVPVIYLTAYADESTFQRAKITEPHGYILKPFEGRELHSAIEIALYKHGAERRLRESERQFRSLFENVPLCVLEVDSTQAPPVVVRSNCQAERAFGWSPDELASVPLPRLFPPESALQLEQVTEALRADKALTIESAGRRRDGTAFPVRISATPGAASGSDHAILAIEDITAEKSRRCEEEAIAEERRRIAREIHDGLAQDLACLRFRVGLWHDLVDRDPAQMHTELNGLREFLRERIRKVRRSIFALRPVELDELGFFPALRRFIDDFGQQHQLRVELHISGPEECLPSSLEPTLFRIIQEVLNNVGRHAQARTASVQLNLEAADWMILTIQDDGVGLDMAILEQAARRGRLGLAQMRERVEALGGTFLLQSQAGRGTRVQTVLPVPKA